MYIYGDFLSIHRWIDTENQPVPERETRFRNYDAAVMRLLEKSLELERAFKEASIFINLFD
jgi:hypothetical protein